MHCIHCFAVSSDLCPQQCKTLMVARAPCNFIMCPNPPRDAERCVFAGPWSSTLAKINKPVRYIAYIRFLYSGGWGLVGKLPPKHSFFLPQNLWLNPQPTCTSHPRSTCVKCTDPTTSPLATCINYNTYMITWTP